MRCRFMFTNGSRGRLFCSREMLFELISRLQVMPSFLDFILEFRTREKAATTAWFRLQDHHSRACAAPDATGLDQHCFRIQHAFNIIAAESGEEYKNYAWPLRHTTVYHSFDVALGTCFWLVIKGNKEMRERVMASSEPYTRSLSNAKKPIADLFEASLESHLLFLEWCTEGWAEYIDYLEERFRKQTTSVKAAPVDDLVKKIPKNPAYTVGGPVRRATGMSQSTQAPSFGGRVLSNLSRMTSGLSNRPTAATKLESPSTIQEQPCDDGSTAHEDSLEDIFSFEHTQNMLQLAEDIDTLCLVIGQNKKIMASLFERYTNLSSDEGLDGLTHKELIRAAISGFLPQLRILQEDLDTHEARAQVLLSGLQKNKDILFGIIQYGNMKVGEHFARSADASARTMEAWTADMHEIAVQTEGIAVKTERATISMLAITILTLVFLPATFVSTLFSSNIWDFSESTTWGDWKTNLPALQLFLTISLLLTASTLFFWGAFYRIPRCMPRRLAMCLARQGSRTLLPVVVSMLGETGIGRLGNSCGRWQLCKNVSILQPFELPGSGLGRGRRETIVWRPIKVVCAKHQCYTKVHIKCTLCSIMRNSPLAYGASFGPMSYIPHVALQTYWKKTRIEEVSKAYRPLVPVKVDAVTDLFLRIFSILVYIDRVQYIPTFFKHQISDAQLPITSIPEPLEAPVYKEVLSGIREHQWLFHPLVLNYALLTDISLEPQHILPFLDEEEITVGDAAHVHKIRVDEACNSLEGNQHRVYVLKQYKNEQNERLYRNESKALTTLQTRRNENIVGYYGSFIQNGTYNLLLEYANGGNLLEFFSNNPHPETPEDVHLFWNGLFGVLKGLHCVHESFQLRDGDESIHQDIKPDNIILSKGYSGSPYDFCPKLADFGHSHFRVGRAENTNEMGVDRHGNQTYGNRIPTQADIFSIGCVLSDAAAWVMFGPTGREAYFDLRVEAAKLVPNFEDPGHLGCFHDGVSRLGAVDAMHDKIRLSCLPEDKLTPEVLGLIETHMLIGEWEKRRSANNLYERFVQKSGLPKLRTTNSEFSGSVSPSDDQEGERFDDSTAFSAGTSPDHGDTFLRSPRSKYPPASPMLPPRPGPRPIQSNHSRNPSSASSAWSPTQGDSMEGLASASETRSPLEDAWSWYKQWKAQGPLNNDQHHRIIRRLNHSLVGRDHIFFVDNSSTMEEHSGMVIQAFTTLAKILTFEKEASISLIMDSNVNGKIHQGPRVSPLVRVLSKCIYSQMGCLIEDRFSNLIDQVVIPRLESRPARRNSASASSSENVKAPDPISLVVFTDGKWGVDSNGAVGLQTPIKRLIDYIKEEKLKRTQVMVEFIRFGDSPEGKRHLEYLVDFGKSQECDIVDTTPATGDICSMLIGSINPSRDSIQALVQIPPVSLSQAGGGGLGLYAQ
ncbi:hypothetical protein GQ53DRAFT_857922 [Thozetella sp. PMI_491]|nr:hypothetical protein GQ53DRAFT_857922 [Thozetella sp. PMI_491]